MVAVDHGNGGDIVPPHQPRHFLLVHFRRHGDVGIFHHFAEGPVRGRQHQALERHNALEAPLVVDDIGLGEIFKFVRLPANFVEALPDRIVFHHGHHLRRHQSTRRLRVILEQVRDLLPLLRVFDLREDSPLLFGLELTEEVGGIVVRKALDDLRRFAGFQRGEGVFGVFLLRQFP